MMSINSSQTFRSYNAAHTKRSNDYDIKQLSQLQDLLLAQRSAASSWSLNVLIRLILIPVGKNVANPRRVGESVHILKVFLCELEWLRGHVGNIFANQLAWIDAGLVDLLEQERSERLDTGTQECADRKSVV